MTDNPRESDTVVNRIVRQVAALTDRDERELPALYGAIEPDALVGLIEHGAEESSVPVEFGYAGTRVTVRGDGEVRADVTSLLGYGERSRTTRG